MTGTHILTSGNTLEWEHVRIGNRGGFRASFGNPPSEADMAEGKAFAEAQKPESAEVVEAAVCSEQFARDQLEQHLYGGNRN